MCKNASYTRSIRHLEGSVSGKATMSKTSFISLIVHRSFYEMNCEERIERGLISFFILSYTIRVYNILLLVLFSHLFFSYVFSTFPEYSLDSWRLTCLFFRPQTYALFSWLASLTSFSVFASFLL